MLFFSLSCSSLCEERSSLLSLLYVVFIVTSSVYHMHSLVVASGRLLHLSYLILPCGFLFLLLFASRGSPVTTVLHVWLRVYFSNPSTRLICCMRLLKLSQKFPSITNSQETKNDVISKRGIR